MADIYGWQLAVDEVERQFGPAKSDAQKSYLEHKFEELWVNDKIVSVASRIYKQVFGGKRFPDIDLLAEIALFYGQVCDDSCDAIYGGWDGAFGVGLIHSITEDDNRDFVRSVVDVAALRATVAYAERVAKGGVAVEKMKKYGRALLGTASAIGHD